MDARVSTESVKEAAVDWQIAKLVKSFQDRAKSLRVMAMAILAVIGLLLFGGAASFVLALQLSDFNRKPDFDATPADLQRQRAAVPTGTCHRVCVQKLENRPVCLHGSRRDHER